MPLIPSDTILPFDLIRLQFPIRAAFAMTINKSQGQTFSFVGIWLEEPCFSHGQLYVALSRVGSQNNIKLFKKPGTDDLTRNVVFLDIFKN